MNTSEKGNNRFFIIVALIAAILCYAISYFCDINNTTIEVYKSVSSVIAQISITMVGFVLACLAILTTMSHYKLIKKMQETGHFYILLTRMFYCISSFLVLVIVSTIMLFHTEKINIFLHILILLSIFSLLLLIDVIRKLWKTVMNLHPSSQ